MYLGSKRDYFTAVIARGEVVITPRRCLGSFLYLALL